MPRLEDLRKELSTLTPDEVRERIRQIRADRKVPKQHSKARKAGVRQKDKTLTILKKLSPEEIAALIKEMEENS